MHGDPVRFQQFDEIGLAELHRLRAGPGFDENVNKNAHAISDEDAHAHSKQ
jgi:hypothetical protein